ncbi:MULTISPECIES: fucose-binding lectin II [unclassified Ochrobactrum]|uniref:fucose-binding lectin II n=1 Tax=unclassified Ochrobactrum TaxID=239106 RepID=UPI0013B413C0|nr:MULTISPECIES: fucose-binding lectin II [unclassified Ochrobactrum]MBQ0710683.1 hypothetical protein [Ochrobactrum sp. AP1BH01-1]
MATTSYLFNGVENIEYNDLLDRCKEGFPIRNSINWDSLPITFRSEIDDIINANDYLFIFKKDKYLKFSIIWRKVVEGPRPIVDGWSGLAGTGFEDGIDAAAEWPDVTDRSRINCVLFTKGAECITYNLDDNTIIKQSIAEKFSADAYPEFCNDIDTLHVWKSNAASYAYIFKGNNYIRYNLTSNKIDKGSVQIDKYWHGVTFTQIQASVSVDNAAMGSCCQCGDADNGQYSFQISPNTKFGLTAYANSDRQHTVSVYIDNQLVDAFSGKGESNTVIGIRTYSSGTGNICVRIEKEGAEPGKVNFCHNRLDSITRSITIATTSDTDDSPRDCTVIINTPLS